MAKATDQSRAGYVTVATVGSRSEACGIAAKLKAVGIESVLSDERAAASSVVARGIGGTKVQVSRNQVEGAVRALQRSASLDGDQSERVQAASTAQLRSRINFDSWGVAALSVAAMIAFAVLLALWLF